MRCQVESVSVASPPLVCWVSNFPKAAAQTGWSPERGSGRPDWAPGKFESCPARFLRLRPRPERGSGVALAGRSLQAYKAKLSSLRSLLGLRCLRPARNWVILMVDFKRILLDLYFNCLNCFGERQHAGASEGRSTCLGHEVTCRSSPFGAVWRAVATARQPSDLRFAPRERLMFKCLHKVEHV